MAWAVVNQCTDEERSRLALARPAFLTRAWMEQFGIKEGESGSSASSSGSIDSSMPPLESTVSSDAVADPVEDDLPVCTMSESEVGDDSSDESDGGTTDRLVWEAKRRAVALFTTDQRSNIKTFLLT